MSGADLTRRALLAAGTPLQAEAVVRGALTRLEGSVGAHHPETLRGVLTSAKKLAPSVLSRQGD